MTRCAQALRCVDVATSPLTEEAELGRIELKTLTADTMRQLQDAGAARREVTELRELLEELVDDDDFCSDQARSLAVFAAMARRAARPLAGRGDPAPPPVSIGSAG